MKNLAGLIKYGDTVNGVIYAGLKPGLKVYLEYSNEVWGGTGNTTTYNNAAAQQEVAAGGSVLNADGSTDQSAWAQRYYLERSMQIVNDLRSVFGPDPSYATVRPVLAWGEGNTYFYNTYLPWFETTLGAPSTYFYGMGNANYGSVTDRSSVDNLIASLYASIASEAATTAQYSAIATYYGMKNVAYEGGPQTSTDNASQGQVALAAARDPRMEDLEVKFYQAWYAAGGDLAMVFDGPYGTYSPNHQWALSEVAQASNPAASAKYRGMVDLSTAATTPLAAGTAVSATGVTALPINADSFGTSFTSPWAGLFNTWLINVPTAGNYTLNLQTNSNYYDGQFAVSTSDTNTAGPVTVSKAAGTYALATLALHAGLNTIAIKTTLAGVNVAGLSLAPKVGTTVSATPGDPSFEALGLGVGYNGFAYDPTGTPWAFAGLAGVSANGSGFTSGNPAAPLGTQVAFLQNGGTISQVMAGWPAGTYTIGFSAAQRGNYGASAQSVRVLVDGSPVGTFAPAGASYQAFTTASFAVSGGSHTITFQGLNTVGDNTAFIDGVTVKPAAATTAVVPGDPSFEALGLGVGYNGFAYDPTGTPWAFAGLAGVSANGSGFTSGNPAAPLGTQVAFLQNGGTISQVMAGWPAGTYTIGFSAAQRGNYGASAQSIRVLVDGSPVGTFAPAGASYQAFTTASFAVSGGSHTITFQGLNTVGDNTAFIDGVTVKPAAAVVAATLGDSGFEALALGTTLGYNGFTYDPTGTPWAFAGRSGVSANGSGFTSGNPAAPQGGQVAFLQDDGAVSQAFTSATAGTYAVSLKAAQRANLGVNQSFRVLIDGVVMSTFANLSTTYSALTTATFALSAGSHTITIQGLVTAGDATAFIDDVNLIAQ